MLDQRQCLLLAGSLKKGGEALEWRGALIDGFLQARARLGRQRKCGFAIPILWLLAFFLMTAQNLAHLLFMLFPDIKFLNVLAANLYLTEQICIISGCLQLPFIGQC